MRAVIYGSYLSDVDLSFASLSTWRIEINMEEEVHDLGGWTLLWVR
ncbi:MAG: hypothetical protein H3Z51_00405 [archaeon]|nr:hypothetical protein [archaeon]